jgi:hypothetical protein
MNLIKTLFCLNSLLSPVSGSGYHFLALCQLQTTVNKRKAQPKAKGGFA